MPTPKRKDSLDPEFKTISENSDSVLDSPEN